MTLLVIGASSELGIATIRAIGKNYDRILAHYRNVSEPLQQLKQFEGDRLQLLQADLASEAETRSMIREIEALGALPTHIVHFPAQPIMLHRFAQTDWEVFQHGLDVSLRSLALVCGAFLPAMAKQRSGKVLAVLSAVVEGTPPKYSADYVVAKYAVLGLIKALAAEYGDRGVTVNGVSPTYVETKFVAGLPESVKEKLRTWGPEGKSLIPEEVAASVARLLSEEGDSVNGQNLLIT